MLAKIIKISLLLTVSLSYASVASAARCEGKIDNIGGNPNGWLTVSGLGGLNHTNLCELNQPSCKTVFGALLAAKLSDKKVALFFKHGSSTELMNCNDRTLFPAWDKPSEGWGFYHFEIN